MKKKGLVIAASVMLVLCLAVGGTLAWLADKTGPVVNTFTYGDINIDLTETTTDYKMIPGESISKDPKVTVEAGSEACWLFVEITKSENYDDYLDGYDVVLKTAEQDGWTLLEEYGVKAVYYREVAATTDNVDFPVLVGDKVTVLGTVTKADMNAIDGIVVNAETGEVTTTEDATELAKRPTLTFKAYAVQKAGFEDDVAGAWDEAQKLS